MTQTFAFRFDDRYRHLARPFGITPERAEVVVDDDTFTARYGPFRVQTPRANVVGADITGPYRMWKTAGPARLAVTDRGLTFASNGDRGVVVFFRERVHGLPGLRHPELTVTVEDPEALLRALAAG